MGSGVAGRPSPAPCTTPPPCHRLLTSDSSPLQLPQVPLSLSTLVFLAEMLIMAILNRISEQEYRELALQDSDRLWELWDGVPREKPLMSMKHGW